MLCTNIQFSSERTNSDLSSFFFNKELFAQNLFLGQYAVDLEETKTLGN
jgi:hypothetical protein